jgi:beta-galactosidase
MDIFRLPKYAAYFYESQMSPEQRIVLQAATVWSAGDRSEGGNEPLVIFSNCDEVEVFVGAYGLGRFKPDREHFPNLPHPPFQIMGQKIHGTWGVENAHLRVVGYVNGMAVAEQKISARGLPHGLVLKADFTELKADGADMTRLVFKIVDECGNRLPYTNQVVTFEIDGPADLIGENPFALMGGQAALYVKARREPGTVTIRATTPRLEAVMETITIT